MSCGLTRAELSSVAAFASFSNERTSSQAASRARPVKRRENRTSTVGGAGQFRFEGVQQRSQRCWRIDRPPTIGDSAGQDVVVGAAR